MNGRVLIADGGIGASVREFISSCQHVTNTSFPVDELPARLGDAAEVYADCSKIQRVSGRFKGNSA